MVSKVPERRPNLRGIDGPWVIGVGVVFEPSEETTEKETTTGGCVLQWLSLTKLEDLSRGRRMGMGPGDQWVGERGRDETVRGLSRGIEWGTGEEGFSVPLVVRNLRLCR